MRVSVCNRVNLRGLLISTYCRRGSSVSRVYRVLRSNGRHLDYSVHGLWAFLDFWVNPKTSASKQQ